MPKTLAELRTERADKPASRPERSITLCLAPDLIAEVQALYNELEALPQPQRDDEGRIITAPPRIGVKPQTEDPRAQGIRDRLAVLLEQMADYDGELRVRAVEDGDWRRWANEHPARAEGEPGYERDIEVAAGFCNADDLIDSLSTYAYSWNGDVLLDGDWDRTLAPSIGGADKKLIATAVVTMHETRVDFQRWRSDLSANLQRSNDSSSPAPSA